MPWWWAQDHLIHLPQVRWAALAVSLAAAALFALLPRRYALVLPGPRRRVLRPHRGRGRERPPRDPQGDRRLALGRHAHAASRLDRPGGRPRRVGVACCGRGRWRRPTRSTRTSSSAAASARSTTSTEPIRPIRCPRRRRTRAPSGVLIDGRTARCGRSTCSRTVEVGGKRVATRPGRRRPLPRQRAGRDPARGSRASTRTTHGRGKSVTYQRVECTGGTLAVAAPGRRGPVQTPQTGRRDRARHGGRPRAHPGDRPARR